MCPRFHSPERKPSFISGKKVIQKYTPLVEKEEREKESL